MNEELNFVSSLHTHSDPAPSPPQIRYWPTDRKANLPTPTLIHFSFFRDKTSADNLRITVLL